MQTRLTPEILASPAGREADEILRACVHCGFCTATCPTYQLLGDELDGPRGRIYQIKQMLEGAEVSAATRRHLDRCLSCRSCETTCPSGVRYGRLLDLGRGELERRLPRGPGERLLRWSLRRLLPHPRRFGPLLRLGQAIRPLLPVGLARWIPGRQAPAPAPPPPPTARRRMLTLDGCVQSVATPATRAATASLLGKLGIGLVSAPGAGCCGALSHHLSAGDEALDRMRRNIDAWWPWIEQGVEAIVISASGCGVVVKEYGQLLRGDPAYADKAARVSALARDIAEILRDEPLPQGRLRPLSEPIAFHSPCTLQHGQRLHGVVESILQRAGFELVVVADPHLCCGSAGSYSILQPGLARRLREGRLDGLQRQRPAVIATANVGCQLHLAGGTDTPVRHWVELLNEALAG